MGEPECRVLPRTPGRVASEAFVEYVDQANLRVPLQRVLHRRRRDCFVVGRFDLPDSFEPDDPVGKSLINSIIRAPSFRKTRWARAAEASLSVLDERWVGRTAGA